VRGSYGFFIGHDEFDCPLTEKVDHSSGFSVKEILSSSKMGLVALGKMQIRPASDEVMAMGGENEHAGERIFMIRVEF
jgi:hypothetical protein